MFAAGSDLGSWAIAAAVGVLSAGLSVGVTVAVLVRLPADHFACEHRVSKSLAARIGRNLAGLVLVALGVVLAFPGVPGQGLLTILLGIMCLDVPGKRRVELWILRRPSVLRGVGKLRARYGKAPLELPGVSASVASGAASGAAGASRGGPGGEATAAAGEAPVGGDAARASRLDKTR